MPIAYEFNPELILVSCGGFNHTTMRVTSELFGYLTYWLSSLANGRIILCLEGGFDLCSISHMCAKALLGDSLPPLVYSSGDGSEMYCDTIRNVLSVQRNYWKCLKFSKKLPYVKI